MNNLKNYYFHTIKFELKNKFNYKNIHEIPKLVKITINMGLGLNGQNKKFLEKSLLDLSYIACQYPCIKYSKKAISNFKIKKNVPIGLFVTLRREKMYNFFEKLVKLVLPRIRDFNGLNINNFDKFGNYNFGLNDILLFPELEYNANDIKKGLNITFVLSNKNIIENIFLLKKLGLPI